MPSPSPSAKLRTNTSYQVRSFQSWAAGVVAGVHAAPGSTVALAAGAEAGTGVGEGGGSDGVPQPAATSTAAIARVVRRVAAGTAEVDRGPPRAPTVDSPA